MRTVSDLLKGKEFIIWSTTPETSVHEALRLMADKNVGALVVLDGKRLVGIFSERDYARNVIRHERLSNQTPVRELMTRNVICVGPEQNIEDCMEIMTNRRVRHLPVLDGVELLGIISIGDVVKTIISEQRSTINHLTDFITGGR